MLQRQHAGGQGFCGITRQHLQQRLVHNGAMVQLGGNQVHGNPMHTYTSIQRLLVLGNPDLNRPELDLPSAQQEAQSLHQKFPTRSELFVRRAAEPLLQEGVGECVVAVQLGRCRQVCTVGHEAQHHRRVGIDLRRAATSFAACAV